MLSEDVRELPTYLPSIVGQMWDPETAIDRHVQQDDRVDIKMVQKRIRPKMGKLLTGSCVVFQCYLYRWSQFHHCKHLFKCQCYQSQRVPRGTV